MSARYRKLRPQPAPENHHNNGKQIIHGDEGEDHVSASAVEILRLIFTVILLNFILSYFITGSFFWNYDSLLMRPRYLKFLWYRALYSSGILTYLQSFLPFSSPLRNFAYPRIFTDSELALYNGRTLDLPIYIAINSSVYDVSSSYLTYGSGGPYNIFAGRDATRAFVTGCFTSDLTHDLRGIDEEKAKTDVTNWQAFFEQSNKYWYVGHVEHEPITGPPPGPCQGRAHAQKPGMESRNS
ncbi:cytochrome b5-like heme/steroid binding domain-containing protein [Kockiozyma suomiensis]|uniref:cytochrome b5-like heme/steroid binding domain-containing protein n=1 Tax=Kockiozyma suomiensis TaxID=1337062 RepID=UPI0033437B68